jgi:hypothetical protein
VTGLKIATGLTLPLDAVTETFALLAVRRAGKSNAAVVMAEEMYDNGLPWVAIDPKGDWWGVRAAGDGEGPGLSVLVFGGLHADVPLEPTAGRMVADLIVENRLTCVLDVSEMSKADMRKFLTAFALRLYQQNKEPLHVFCEEADEYIPQRVMGPDAALVGAFEKLIKRGGFRGIGVTLITQRSASLNKDVLTQVGTLIPMRTPSPQDRKAILAWVDTHDAGKDAVDDLPSLANGEAYVFSPQWLDVLQKIQFRRRRTFDSGSTPKVGETVRQPSALATVDLDAIKEAMADTIEKAEADDPKTLHRRIADLEKENGRLKDAAPETERVEVPVLDDEAGELLREIVSQHAVTGQQLADHIRKVYERLAEFTVPAHQLNRAGVVARPRARTEKEGAESYIPRPAGSDAPSTSGLGKAARLVVAVLAQHGPCTRTKLALLAGYSSKGGGFNNALSSLRSAGLLTGGNDDLQLTVDGETAAADVPPLPSGQELIDQWRATLGGGAPRKVFDTLLDVWPEALDRAELADRAEYAPTGGGFNNAISKLRTLGLLVGDKDGMRVSDAIGEAR